jgi:hypothetical protein
MKLTKNLRAAILRQFKDGADTVYLASLYEGISVRQVEEVIRQRLIEQEKPPAARVDEALQELKLAVFKS